MHSQDPMTVFRLKEMILIHFPTTTLTVFDWLNNRQNDLLLCGDFLGNIYLLKIYENKYEIIKTYFHAHSEDITDLRFFPNNHEEDVIFASCSNDGYLKIFDSNDNETPLYDIQISKVDTFNYHFF